MRCTTAIFTYGKKDGLKNRVTGPSIRAFSSSRVRLLSAAKSAPMLRTRSSPASFDQHAPKATSVFASSSAVTPQRKCVESLPRLPSACSRLIVAVSLAQSTRFLSSSRQSTSFAMLQVGQHKPYSSSIEENLPCVQV